MNNYCSEFYSNQNIQLSSPAHDPFFGLEVEVLEVKPALFLRFFELRLNLVAMLLPFIEPQIVLGVCLQHH
jgi:hypothetical protein